MVVTELWNSTTAGQGSLRAKARAGDVVSIYPLEQWEPKRLTVRLRLTSRATKFTGACSDS